jgi:hypothetical protein
LDDDPGTRSRTGLKSGPADRGVFRVTGFAPIGRRGSRHAKRVAGADGKHPWTIGRIIDLLLVAVKCPLAPR